MDHAPHTPQSPAASAPAGMVPLPGGLRAHDLGALVAGRSAPLPYVLRNVAENLLHAGDRQGAEAVAAWMPGDAPLQCGLTVSRVLLPDSSGIPVLMDLAALRDAVAEAGGDPAQVEPSIPVDLVVDHSLIVDRYGRDDAIDFNAFREYQRNGERYSFLKWAQQAFRSLRIVPPGMGIVHQVHLEYLAQITREPAADDRGVLASEFVLGCDSHTPMINALGVLGWGVGGVDAEAALIGEPYKIRIPRVVGVRLTGTLSGAATTTDLVLHVTQRLRETGVVGDFLEFIGPGLDGIGVPDRATLANMAPEYGATCAFFPVDRQTLAYLEATGRSQDHVARVEAHARATGLWRDGDAAEPVYSDGVEIDLGRIEPSIAGPKRPQDRIALDCSAESFAAALSRPASEGGFGVADRAARRRVELESGAVEIGHGALAIAAITACTNTSNPGVMCAAGLLARNAVARGLKAAPWVKTSLAPGSRVVTRMLDQAGLSTPLEALGFFTVGYGCTTCSGKSGPIPQALSDVADDLVLCAALSGNRNFEGRVHGDVRGAYLCSPPLVVAFALAGTMAVDFGSEPLGSDPEGRPVYLRDIWPDAAEIRETLQSAVSPEDYRENYAGIFEGTALWQKLQANRGPLFGWDRASTYLKRPPFLDAGFLARRADWPDEIAEARALAVFGDSLTTDHVTPSGAIAADTLAGRYLMDCGEKETALNAYTQRRGNHDVMARATFANPRIANLLAGERRGGWSRTAPAAPLRPVFDVAEEYRREGIATIVLAGRDFGMGSSRDWAAKGPALLGVKAVIAKNFERIHRANLVALGIAPFRFVPGEGVAELGLDGFERFTIRNLHAVLESGAPAEVEARASDGSRRLFRAELDTHDARERALLRDGGVFARMLARFDGAGSEQKSGRTNP